MSLVNINTLNFQQLPFFPLSSGDQLLSIMFAAPSGFANVSGILPSGEANFLDFSQVETYIHKNPQISPKTFNNPTTHSAQSIVAPVGLNFYQSPQFQKAAPYYIDTNGTTYIQALSNAQSSRDFSINDFNIFNRYVHYESSGTPDIPDPALDPINIGNDPFIYGLTFNPSNFISLGVTRFNLYSKQYRT
jgi:hypothetical protein